MMSFFWVVNSIIFKNQITFILYQFLILLHRKLVLIYKYRSTQHWWYEEQIIQLVKRFPWISSYEHVESLVDYCSISIANVLDMLQSCTKPSMLWSATSLWRHRWRHYHAKYFFGLIWDVFSYLRSNCSCIGYLKISKMATILSSRQTFSLDVILEVK